jgi:hypothetical protein
MPCERDPEKPSTGCSSIMYGVCIIEDCLPIVAGGGEGFATCNPPCTNEWFCFDGVCSHATPIVVDVDGDGFGLTSGEGGVHFDLNGDGRGLCLTMASCLTIQRLAPQFLDQSKRRG